MSRKNGIFAVLTPRDLFFQAHIRLNTARFLLVFYALILVNGVAFRHAHRLANGQIITHSHPFKACGESPIQPNSHTTNELQLLDAIANGLFVGGADFVFTFSPIIGFINASFFSSYKSLLSQAITLAQTLRGPPALGLFLHF